MPDSVSAVHNPTNATRDVESEVEAVQDGRIREITVDDVDRDIKVLIHNQHVLFRERHNLFSPFARVRNKIVCKNFCKSKMGIVFFVSITFKSLCLKYICPSLAVFIV